MNIHLGRNWLRKPGFALSVAKRYVWMVFQIHDLCPISAHVQENCKGTAKATPWTMSKASAFLISECSDLATITHKYSELNRENN